MHTASLTKGTYTQGQIKGDAETGNADSGPYFQNIEFTPESVIDGTLHQRLDPIAFPQVGITYTGTDADGVAVPAPAKSALF